MISEYPTLLKAWLKGSQWSFVCWIQRSVTTFIWWNSSGVRLGARTPEEPSFSWYYFNWRLARGLGCLCHDARLGPYGKLSEICMSSGGTGNVYSIKFVQHSKLWNQITGTEWLTEVHLKQVPILPRTQNSVHNMHSLWMVNCQEVN